jgi:guanylate kinase
LPTNGSGALAGHLFVVSGPSGVGKGTVVGRLLQIRPDLLLSVSCTTRVPRPGEVDGRDYRFISDGEFRTLIDEGAFLEWAEIYGDHRSGTLLAPVERALADGKDVILEIDVQGAGKVKARMPEATLIFLAPPSEQELVRRLRRRRTETDEQLSRRLAAARGEMEQAGWFDHVVVNDAVDRAATEVAAIIEGASHREGESLS